VLCTVSPEGRKCCTFCCAFCQSLCVLYSAMKVSYTGRCW